MARRTGALVAAALAAAAPAAAGDPENLIALDLPAIDGAVPVTYSPSAEPEAKIYAETFNRAVAWLRQQLDWHDDIAMAVLNAEHYPRISVIPYPVPYADTTGGRLVVMPDRIDTFPGFDKWDLEPVSLNTALTLHEIGHIIARRTGLWSGNLWVNELIANVFLAGYARAEDPSFAVLLNGVPPRFGDAGKLTSLSELDMLYSGVGLENYAWFQFRLADLADHIVEGRDFATVVRQLREAFPAARATVESPGAVLTRLDRIAPGAAALAADMVEPSDLPAPIVGRCTFPPDYREGSAVVFVENRSAEPLTYQRYEFAVVEADIRLMTGEIDSAGRDAFIAASMGDFRFASVIEPGDAEVTMPSPGEVYAIKGASGCFVVPDGPSRLVWTGD